LNNSVTWSTSGVTANYDNVNEYPTPNDDDFNYTSGSYATDTFKFEPFALPSEASSISVKVYVRARLSSGSGSYDFNTTLTCSATDYHSSDITLTTSWTDYNSTWTTNPKTSSAWTVADINGTSSSSLSAFGYRARTFLGRKVEVSQAYLFVQYTQGDKVFIDVSQLYMQASWFPSRPVLGIHIYKNGTNVASHYRPLSEDISATNQNIDIVKELTLTAGDVIKILVTKTKVGDIIYGNYKYTYLCIHRLSGLGI